MKCPIITISNEVMGGTPVFAKTRVPLLTLIDYLKAGTELMIFSKVFQLISASKL